jgi:hypothetical protein
MKKVQGIYQFGFFKVKTFSFSLSIVLLVFFYILAQVIPLNSTYNLKSIYHGSVFFVITLLLLYSFESKKESFKFFVMVTIVTVLAVLEEALDIIIKSIPASLMDILYDVVGASLGIFFYYIFKYLRRKEYNKV